MKSIFPKKYLLTRRDGSTFEVPTSVLNGPSPLSSVRLKQFQLLFPATKRSQKIVDWEMIDEVE